MDKEIKSFITDLALKTGIRFSVYTTECELIDGEDFLKGKTVDNINEVGKDQDLNLTFFPFDYKGKKLIGVLNGVGQIESNYAFLISKLAENLYFKNIGLNKSEFLKLALLGELGQEQIYKYLKKFSVEDQSAYAMIIEVDKNHLEYVKSILVSSGGGLDFAVTLSDGQVAFAKFIDENSEFQSPIEYAEFIKQTVYEETGVNCKIAIGSTVKGVASLGLSYAQAVLALRMQETLGSKGDIHTFKEFLLMNMLEDLPKYKLKESLDALMDAGVREVFSDPEMIETAEEFLENSLNTSETSRKLYLHRNTLIYRLDKIERTTGLNIRKFSDAVTFRLITILSRLVQ